jgi:hypothetical protein
MEVATHFKVQPVELSIPYMKHLRAQPQDLTRTSQLASCKRGFSGSGSDETSVDNGFICGILRHGLAIVSEILTASVIRTMYIRLHGPTSRKTAILIFIAMIT